MFAVLFFSTLNYALLVIIILPAGFVVGLIVLGVKIALQKPKGQHSGKLSPEPLV
jgi:hypothetical protein